MPAICTALDNTNVKLFDETDEHLKSLKVKLDAAGLKEKYKFRMGMLVKTVSADKEKMATFLKYPTEVLKCQQIVQDTSELHFVVDVEQDADFRIPLPMPPKGAIEDDELVMLATHIIRCCADGCKPK